MKAPIHTLFQDDHKDEYLDIFWASADIPDSCIGISNQFSYAI